MGARFQVDIESCAARFLSGLIESKDFGMFHALVGVAAVADNRTIRIHDGRANAWIG
jgi:nucleoside phosphorylase